MAAFVRLAFFPGGTREQYEALRDELAGAPMPPSRLAFAAGPVPSGWQVVQIWESADDLAAFNQRWFLPAVQRAAGRSFTTAPVVVDFDAVDLALPAHGNAAHLPSPDASR